MQTIHIAPGVRLHSIPGEKFKRARLAMYFITPATREGATKEALLPMVMERGFEECPDASQLSIKLAKMYGAGLSLASFLNGANRVLAFSVSGIQDRYALNGEALTQEYTELLLGVALRPALENGAFIAKEVEIEKQKLSELIAAEINEKRSYCIRQATRSFYAGTPFDVERLGYPEDIAHITPQGLYETYENTLKNAQIEVFAAGCDTAAVAAALQNAFAGMQRTPAAVQGAGFVPAAPVREQVEKMNTVQGKVCMMFTPGQAIEGRERAVMRVAMAVLGSSPTSRLFMNVREKQSLCYYCSAQFVQASATIRIDSGVEHENAQRTQNAIMHEIEMLAQTPPSEEELANAKRSYLNALQTVQDSIAATEGWYFSENVFGSGTPLEEYMGQVQSVTKEEVQAMLAKIKLSVVHTIGAM
ncbi:insulinase family protein [Ruminococcaceae bacterium OttesenSCG-928-N02]|nr:insulinase family protein [Ruminococcaceae bacterium OttesenSCG-928-N02]